MFLCCLSTLSASLLTVLETTSDIGLFDPHTGAELDNSSTLGHKQVTVCARFFNYQFTTHNYENPFQFLLGFGKAGAIGSQWQNSDLKVITTLGGQFGIPIWDMKVWNHICIIPDLIKGNLSIIMNGKTVLKKDFKSDLSFLDTNLFLMGHNCFKVFFPFTDIATYKLNLPRCQFI